MHVIRVAPLAALPNTVPQVLDYFWAKPLPEGSMVRVTIGRRAVIAIVLESSDIEQMKMTLRKSSFGLKKLVSVVTDIPQVTPEQLALARWMARQYYTPLGLCLKAILPSFIGKRGNLLQVPVVSSQLPETENRKLETSQIILTQPNTAFHHIRTHLRTAKGQTLLVVPEVSLAEYLSRELTNFSPALVHSGLGVKAYTSAYRAALDGSARLVVGTRLALFLPFKELTHILIEDPLHEAYKSDMSPRYNTPDVAKQVCDVYDAALTFLSPSLSAVNHYLINKKIFQLTDDKPHWPRVIHVDMVVERQGDNRSLLSRTVQGAILDAYDDHRPMLVISPRRAYSTALTCQRCHKPVLCATCAIPMRVHRTSEDMLVCYHCAAYVSVPKQCPSCHAGPLRSAGLAGSQKIAEAIDTCLDRHGLLRLKVPILDSDLVQSEADENRILVHLDTMVRPILVATQMIFSHRYMRTFSRIAVIEADALAYNPDFRTQERLIYQFEKLADFKPETLYIQSWDRSGILAHAEDRSWSECYAQELSDRKALGWPPFSRLVKLSFSHREKSTADRAARSLAERLQQAADHLGIAKSASILGPTPALVQRSGGRWTQHIIIKSSLTAQRLSALLDHVSRDWIIDIDPRSIT